MNKSPGKNDNRGGFKLGDLIRPDGRKWDQLRKVRVERPFLKYAEGSALFELGDTRVVCAVSVEEKVPPFLKGTGQGWVTGEYAMIPRSTQNRIQRDQTGKTQGRTFEIQRLIGRALRAVTDTAALGERTLWADCDVLQADGGTRTAGINGAFLALVDALRKMRENGQLRKWPVEDFLAAVSVGVVDRKILLDLSYIEDSQADVDMTLVMTGKGKLVEIQAGGEGTTFDRDDLAALVKAGEKGIKDIVKLQKELLGELK